MQAFHCFLLALLLHATSAQNVTIFPGPTSTFEICPAQNAMITCAGLGTTLTDTVVCDPYQYDSEFLEWNITYGFFDNVTGEAIPHTMYVENCQPDRVNAYQFATTCNLTCDTQCLCTLQDGVTLCSDAFATCENINGNIANQTSDQETGDSNTNTVTWTEVVDSTMILAPNSSAILDAPVINTNSEPSLMQGVTQTYLLNPPDSTTAAMTIICPAGASCLYSFAEYDLVSLDKGPNVNTEISKTSADSDTATDIVVKFNTRDVLRLQQCTTDTTATIQQDTTSLFPPACSVECTKVCRCEQGLTDGENQGQALCPIFDPSVPTSSTTDSETEDTTNTVTDGSTPTAPTTEDTANTAPTAEEPSTAAQTSSSNYLHGSFFLAALVFLVELFFFVV